MSQILFLCSWMQNLAGSLISWSGCVFFVGYRCLGMGIIAGDIWESVLLICPSSSTGLGIMYCKLETAAGDIWMSVLVSSFWSTGVTVGGIIVCWVVFVTLVSPCCWFSFVLGSCCNWWFWFRSPICGVSASIGIGMVACCCYLMFVSSVQWVVCDVICCSLYSSALISTSLSLFSSASVSLSVSSLLLFFVCLVVCHKWLLLVYQIFWSYLKNVQ